MHLLKSRAASVRLLYTYSLNALSSDILWLFGRVFYGQKWIDFMLESISENQHSNHEEHCKISYLIVGSILSPGAAHVLTQSRKHQLIARP